MPAKRQWRTITCVVAALSVVLGLGLSMTGPAQAAGVGTDARTAPGHAADHQQEAKPDPQVDQTQKAAEAHYTNAPCNRAQDNFLERHLARCFSVVRTALDHQINPAADPPPTALGPADIQDAYNLPDTGDGMTVGIVDAFGDSHAEADLASFRSFYGLPACTTASGCLTIVNQDGDTSPLPPDDPGWGLETSLDLDAVSSACPSATSSWSRATTTPWTTSASPSTRRCPWAPSSSRTPTACRVRLPTSWPSTTSTTTRVWPSPPAPATRGMSPTGRRPTRTSSRSAVRR
jgi:hypothetical protein